MARILLWIGLGICIVWFINTTQLLDIIVLFLLAGAIPGTRILLPPLVMMVVLSLLLLLAAYWLKRQEPVKQIRTMKAKHEATIQQAPRKRSKKPPAASYLSQLIVVVMLVELHVLPRFIRAYKKIIQNIARFAVRTKTTLLRIVKNIRQHRWFVSQKRNLRQFIHR